jgi:glycosyltransferase involved in cell wall biosynthesis
MISVIIPHLNQPDALEACLCSLESQTLERSRFEIIVVDNGSSTSPRAIIDRHCGVRLLSEKEPGPGLARNAGAKSANGDILAFIDADCRAHCNWLRTIQQTLETAPPRTILGGDVQIWRSGAKTLTAIEAYESVFAYRFQLYIEQRGFSGTGNMAAFRRDFEIVGPFAGINVAEDMDWGQRACAAGFRFRYVSGMIVYHPARVSLRELYAKWDRQIQHYFNMAEGKPGWRWRWAARALLVLGSPVVDVITVFRSDRVQGVSSRFKGSAVLCAIRVRRAIKMLALLSGARSIVWNREAGV